MFGRGLMWQSGKVALWREQSQNLFELCRALATSAKPEWRWDKPRKWRILTDFYRLRYAEIWNRTKNVVTLHCQNQGGLLAPRDSLIAMRISLIRRQIRLIRRANKP